MKSPRLLCDNTGYTLTEVLVVVSLIVIMSSIGYSGFSSWQKKEKVRSAAYELSGHLKEARMKAIEKSCSYFVDFGATQYTIYMDDGDNTFNANDVIVRQVNLAELDSTMTVTVNNVNYPLRYDIRGYPRDTGGGFGAGTITFANTDGFRVGVTISSLGSVTVNENN